MKQLLLTLLLSACGAQVAPHTPQKDYPLLRSQVERVEPLLAWTCDGMIPARKHGFPCIKEGDGVSLLGRWILDSGDTAKMSAILSSVGENGAEPRRNPARQGMPESSAFSRDQMLGLLEATVASGNRTGLQSVMQYVSATGRLCSPGDDRCDLTPSVRLLANAVLGKRPGKVERAQDELTIQAEALSSPPTYRSYLVARKILLWARLGQLTKGYATAAKTLKSRYPHSAFISLVAAVAGHGSFGETATMLSKCLAQWEGPGDAWIGMEMGGCLTRSYGHHLVGMAYFLLDGKKDTGGFWHDERAGFVPF
jgi:hypothetical protein